MRLALRNEVRSLESELIRDGGMPSVALMETAGRQIAAALLRENFHGCRLARVACGRGNNGGDGFVIARYLREAGIDVRVQLVGLLDELAGDPAVYARLFRWCGGEIEEQPLGDLGPGFPGELQIDALLGTGLDRPIEGAYGVAVDALNTAGREGRLIYAVDIPSGLDADKGHPLGEAVRARFTGTLGIGKPGLFVTPGMEYAGRVEVMDLGLPARSLELWAKIARYLDDGEPLLKISARPVTSHKGTYGHVMVMGGSLGKAGAADLACRGALRAGAGLVTLCAPQGVQAAWPEVMHAPLSQWSADGWRDALVDKKTALVFGPGTGTSVGVRDFLARVCATELPLVIDADGLNLLAEEPGLLAARRAATVLTPHPAEASRLLGVDTLSVQLDRCQSALVMAEKYRAVVVLKGARSVIALPGGRFWINSTGSPALAAGGMGDVLAGMVGAFLGEGLAPERAACLAAYVHGRAAQTGGFSAGGLRASELADRIPAEIDRLVSL